MRTVDFSKVLVDAIHLCGLDRDEFTLQTFKQIRDLASARLRYAWEYDRYPDLMRYVNVATVTNGDNVTYAVKPTNAGEILGVWDRNPISGTRAKSIPFHIWVTDTEERLVILRAYTEGVYVEYRTKPPELKGLPWSNSIVYGLNAQCYYGGLQPIEGEDFSANFYVSLSNSGSGMPVQDPTKWQKIEIPYIFGPYLSRAVYADYLRSEGQVESANVAEAEAKAFLDEEIDKIVRQQGQYPKYQFIKSY